MLGTRLGLAAACVAGTVALAAVTGSSLAMSSAGFTGPGGPECGNTWGHYSGCDWPEFHLNADLTGYTTHTTLSTAKASTLGVKWANNLQSAALDSPVVAYDPIRGLNLAYIGTESGDFEAVDVATGQTVWSDFLGSAIRTTPMVVDGWVYAGTFNTSTIYKMNADTGVIGCSYIAPMPIEGTPIVATPPGGVQTLYVGTNDSTNKNGPEVAMTTSNCKKDFLYNGFPIKAGSWDAVGYAVTAGGTPLVIFGTADPDSAV
ncbi:MAG TPA: PQQ-binding-like beta-propeller repeat protein, partial [Acidimicrobiales bacterium]|nr:PQQ-binding-like beta-propeller repeat protein [Acidimicrobiales bacterium]